MTKRWSSTASLDGKTKRQASKDARLDIKRETLDLEGEWTAPLRARLALRARVAQLERALWQPIETAPKDGTRILACALKDSRPLVAVTWWRRPEDDAGYIGWGEFNPNYWPAMYWMPIPEFPRDLKKWK